MKIGSELILAPPTSRPLARCDDHAGNGPQAPVGAAGLSVELRRDLALRPEDAASLETFIAARPELGVFLSSAWLSALFAEPPNGCEPALVLIREAGLLRAIAPVAIRHTLTHVHVGLLGGGGLGSDRIDLLAATGFEARAADTFLTWLHEAFGRRALILELRDAPTDSPLWGALHRAGLERRHSFALQPREVHTLPYLDLAGSWTSNIDIASRSPIGRSLERHRRWLEHRGRVTIQKVEDLDDVMSGFEQLRQFLHQRWRRAGGSVLDDPRALRFHRCVLPLLARAGRLRMIRLLADARPIAIFYGLTNGGWWGYYLAGYDREWAGRIHLGQITLAAAIDLASQEGAREFDFLKGADRVKYSWPVRERSTLDADVYSERAGAQLKRATRASRDAVVALAKSVRDLLPKRPYGSYSSVR